MPHAADCPNRTIYPFLQYLGQVRVATFEARALGQAIGEGALTLCPCGKELLYHPERLLTDRVRKVHDLWDSAHLAKRRPSHTRRHPTRSLL